MFAHISTADLGLTCPEPEPINTDVPAVGTGVEASTVPATGPVTTFLSKSASQKMQSKTKTGL